MYFWLDKNKNYFLKECAKMNHEEVGEMLRAHAEEKYAVFAKSLLPDLSRKMLGVRIPVLRKIARKIVQQDWRVWLDGASDDTFEEVLLQGLVLGAARMPYVEAMERMQVYVQKIDNWSLCDSACNSFGFVREHPDESWNLLLSYCYSGVEYQQRFGVVMFLCHFLTADYKDRLLAVLAKVCPVGYYDRMAVAWAVSASYVKFPKETEALLVSRTLDNETCRKAVQKINESRCISLEDKKRCRLYCK